MHMSVSIRDAEDCAHDRRWLESQYPQYLDDLGGNGVQTAGVAVHLQWQDEWMASWFAAANVPLIILSNRRPAGFALVGPSPQPGIDQRMLEFYIAPAQRRAGVGRRAARLIFGRFGGTWEITTSLGNHLALSFWRSLLQQYSGGRHRERFLHGEVSQVFTWPQQR